MLRRTALVFTLGLLPAVPAVWADQAANRIDGISFATSPGKLYLPLDEATRKLGWSARHNKSKKSVRLRNETFSYSALRTLTDGTILVSLADLAKAGAPVTRNTAGTAANVGTSRKYFTVAAGPKRAEINLAKQTLQAWQGKRLVLKSRISSGRRGSTPSGNYTAGPYKSRTHFSSRYNNAAMPWSVQVTGHIFIHGFTSVPKYPASHGCIRLPLNEGNPARFFYEWVNKGTPIRIKRK